jgi:tetratricopeptide (TPR) repeat protein
MDACTHLKMAHKYLLDIANDKASEPPAAQQRALQEKLQAASKHLEDARRKDPSAEILVELNKQQVSVNCDRLCALALSIEATFAEGRTASTADLTRALTAIDKALTYAERPHFHVQRARILTRLLKREEALHAIDQALALTPDYLEAIELKDKLTANPNIGCRPFYEQYVPVILLMALCIFPGVYYLFVNPPLGQLLSVIGGIGLVGALVVGVAHNEHEFAQKRLEL